MIHRRLTVDGLGGLWGLRGACLPLWRAQPNMTIGDADVKSSTFARLWKV